MHDGAKADTDNLPSSLVTLKPLRVFPGRPFANTRLVRHLVSRGGRDLLPGFPTPIVSNRIPLARSEFSHSVHFPKSHRVGLVGRLLDATIRPNPHCPRPAQPRELEPHAMTRDLPLRSIEVVAPPGGPSAFSLAGVH